MKKILLLGGTGAMGVYLVPELLSMGYAVDVIALDERESDHPHLRYFKGNAKDNGFLAEFLKNGYDGIVDFLCYSKVYEFAYRQKMLLESTKHYIFLSTYRIYADEEHPIKESSPRLLDASLDDNFLMTNDYSLYKAADENRLKECAYTNWTVVRPAITYSKRRFQLTTLEADTVVARALQGKKLVVPLQAKDKQATMSWAGDVAKMIARLLFNEKAYRETYSVCTAEHMTWGAIADIYRELIGVECVWVDKEDYIDILSLPSSRNLVKYQLEYDRLFDRIMDNSKILAATGMKQEELSTLRDGLARELATVTSPDDFIRNDFVNERMDAYLAEKGLA